MAINRIFGPNEEDTIHNKLVNLLKDIGVITANERADMLKGTLIFPPGYYSAGFMDIGTGDDDDTL